jgi:hypothetical protein
MEAKTTPKVAGAAGGLAEEHQLRDHLRVGHGEGHGEESAHRVPGDRHALEPKRIDHPAQELGPVRTQVDPAVIERRRQSAPGSVRHQEVEARGEPREQGRPRHRDAVAPVDHQHRIAGPDLEQLDAQRRGPDVDEPGRRSNAGFRQGGILQPPEPLCRGLVCAHGGPLLVVRCLHEAKGDAGGIS